MAVFCFLFSFGDARWLLASGRVLFAILKTVSPFVRILECGMSLPSSFLRPPQRWQSSRCVQLVLDVFGFNPPVSPARSWGRRPHPRNCRHVWLLGALFHACMSTVSTLTRCRPCRVRDGCGGRRCSGTNVVHGGCPQPSSNGFLDLWLFFRGIVCLTVDLPTFLPMESMGLGEGAGETSS